ncbi:hypothetical protein [Streptomyces sp. NPDC088760]|uniref:hypothetical protein n=1 Tax=Streptomyces sp. NPDC088760 TaxID=3365890 RepID=UPI0038283125
MTDYTALVAAAAHAADPAPTGLESSLAQRSAAQRGAAWLARVQHLAVELAFTARQVEQDMTAPDASRPFAADVEIEESSCRGLLTLRPPSGQQETIRTEQDTTVPGRAMNARAQELVGRWVLVSRINEFKSGEQFKNVRMVLRLMDLGQGSLATDVARQVLIGEGGNEQRAAKAWRDAGLPLTRPIPVADLEPVRRTLRAEQP